MLVDLGSGSGSILLLRPGTRNGFQVRELRDEVQM